MQRSPASGGQVGASSSPVPALVEVLEKTKAAVNSNRPWYEALVLQGQAAEARAGEQVTAVVVEGLSCAVDALNVDLLKPVCAGLQALFSAVKGATAAREELIDLLSYCVSITSIILNKAQLGKLPEHIKDALQQVKAEINDINKISILFDRKTGCCAPLRRLRLHARDREEIKEHKARLEEILDLATKAAVLDSNAVAHKTLAELESVAKGPPPPDMATLPMSAPSLPSSYVARSSLLNDVVGAMTKSSDSMRSSRVLLGVGGSGKTVLASAVVSEDRIRKHYRRGISWVQVRQSSNMINLLQTLARGIVGNQTGHVEFSSEEEGIQRVTALVSKEPSPRLVVLDDVLEADAVNGLRQTGLHLLITTRIRDVLGAGGECTEVGNMTKEEASALLKKQSGAIHLPEAEANKVAEACGWLALALAIAGALPCIKKNPNDLEAWRDLHVEIREKKRAEGDEWMAPSTVQDEAKLALFPVLSLGMDHLGEDAQDMFFNLVVLARGVPAPVDMLTNLWRQKDEMGAIENANLLAGRSLVQEVRGGHYQLQNLVLDFLRMRCSFKCRNSLVQGAVERQRKYLGRLAVLQRYRSAVAHLSTGLYALVSLWRSLEELSGADRMEEAYTASLGKLGDIETKDTADAYNAVAGFLFLTGKYSEADSLYLRAIEIGEKTFPDDPDFATKLHNRALLLKAQGKHTEAVDFLERALSIRVKKLGENHAETVNTRNTLEFVRDKV